MKSYVNDYQDGSKEQENETAVLDILPGHVASELLYEVRSPVLMDHPFFSALYDESIWALRCVCCEVVKMNDEAFRRIPRTLQDNRAVWFAAVGKNGYALLHTPNKLRNGQGICLEAVSNFGGALESASRLAVAARGQLTDADFQAAIASSGNMKTVFFIGRLNTLKGYTDNKISSAVFAQVNQQSRSSCLAKPFVRYKIAGGIHVSFRTDGCFCRGMLRVCRGEGEF